MLGGGGGGIAAAASSLSSAPAAASATSGVASAIGAGGAAAAAATSVAASSSPALPALSKTVTELIASGAPDIFISILDAIERTYELRSVFETLSPFIRHASAQARAAAEAALAHASQVSQAAHGVASHAAAQAASSASASAASQQASGIAQSLGAQNPPALQLPAEDFFNHELLSVIGAPEWTTLLLTVQAFIYLGTANFALGGRVPPEFLRRMSRRSEGLNRVSALAVQVLQQAMELHRLVRRLRELTGENPDYPIDDNTQKLDRHGRRQLRNRPSGLRSTHVPYQPPHSFPRANTPALPDNIQQLQNTARRLHEALFTARAHFRSEIRAYISEVPSEFRTFIGSVFAFIDRIVG